MRPLITTLLLLIVNTFSHSQYRIIRGQVLDTEDKSPWAGVSVYLIKDSSDANTTPPCGGRIGTLTNMEGMFEIEFDTAKSSCYNFLEIVNSGSITQVIPITEKNEYLITLKSGLEPLEEMEIYKPAIYLYPQKKTSI